ncbi:PTS transporter subunit EIIC [Enterococcus faecium]|uniref:PTS system mannitol-specific IICB component n=1 Tax=Enterococcus faecium TaxID=1352 RepID=A0A242BM28_ENTFC|nr:PTS transporter subunit EIIC [Enterococcus faecium]OTN96190.1 PTS system mannitol-specific IICB component [Enterococcus faecium]
MEYKWKANGSSRVFTKQLRKAGHHLNEMIMPNLSLFIAWGILSLVIKGVSGDLHATLEKVCHWMIQLLLPILISYSGGKSVGGQKGAVAGAIASLGLIARSDAPQIVGAMIIGPLAGILYEQFVSRFHAKFRAGYEMLVSNLLVGLIGSVICIIGIVFIEPALNSFHLLLVSVVSWLVKMNLLPLVSLILEPLKVLFFNNAINHGVLTPLGIEFSQAVGHSYLFLMEANPGPGLGILLAILCFAKKQEKVNASGALMIHAIGGIHEIYFPFVLLRPSLFLAVMVGGASGTLIFQWLDAGLATPVSPGSLLVIFANTPYPQLAGVSIGIALSTLVTFICATLLLKLPKKEKGDNTVKERGEILELSTIHSVVFACDSGMGSSAMGAALLKKKLAAEKIDLAIGYSSVYELNNQVNQLVIVQHELADLAREKVPQSQIFVLDHFLETDILLSRIKEAIHEPNWKEKKERVEVAEQKKSLVNIVFLYKNNRRGSQTMGMAILSQLAKKEKKQFVILKEPIEQLKIQEETIYIAQRELAVNEQLKEKIPQLVLVEHWVATNEYEKLVKGEK